MEGNSAKNMSEKTFCKFKNNSRPPKKRKPSKSQVNNKDGCKRKVVTGINSSKLNSFRSRNTSSKSWKSNSQTSEEGIFSVKPLSTIKSSKKLKCNTAEVSQTNFKNIPTSSKQLKNKAKKAKKRKFSRTDSGNTSEMLNVTSNSKSKKIKRNLKTSTQDLNEKEEISEYCASNESESDEDNLREEIQNSSIFQKIQKLMAKSPELNPSLKNSKITSGSLQNIGDSSTEYITDNSSDVSFHGMSADSIDEDSSEDGKKDTRILESSLQSCSKDDLKITSKKQNISFKKYDKNIDPKILPKDETSFRNSFDRNKKSALSTNLKNKVHEKLAAAKFRFLNEKLYTRTGKEAFRYFKENNDEFEDYHLGYRQQVSKWPINPVNEIISDLQKSKKNVVIADLGCGDAKIAQVFPNKTVHSFDLVPLNEHVKACDISKVPLPNESVDVAVFCLSLMGINLKDYLCEAFRILKVGGILKIAEVESRIENLEHFINYLRSIGFALEKKNTKHKMFVFLDLKKEKKNCKSGKLPEFSLRPCLYKRR